MHDKNTLGIVALLVGGFGVHWFILNKPLRGVLYFFFCLTFIPAIAALVEAIQFFTMDQREFDRKYNAKHLPQQGDGGAPATRPNHIMVPAIGADLVKWQTLLDQGNITLEEFEKKKQQLLYLPEVKPGTFPKIILEFKGQEADELTKLAKALEMGALTEDQFAKRRELIMKLT